MSFGKREGLAAALVAVGQGGYVGAKDVTLLRQGVFKDGIVDDAELDALFDLGARAPEGDPEWIHFFAEAAADFYLRETEPHGYLTDEELQTLKARVLRDKGRASGLELAMLVKILETAKSTPPGMTDFVGEQIVARIRAKKGGARVSAQEASLIRRFIFAVGGAGNVGVSRREAEFLFDIADMTAGAKNDPAWTELFVKAIANHLMAHLGYVAPTYEEAKATEAFIKNQSVDIGGFFKRMIDGSLSGVGGGSPQAARNAAREAGAREAEKVTAEEADWVVRRIRRDGALHPAEKALVEHLKSLGDDLPPPLKSIVG
ncbi:MAG: hypothetical protein K2Q06_13165 [Parvularculaceae bacterium]|nr:hypothetical protein [Parvularculaceae bacterium]